MALAASCYTEGAGLPTDPLDRSGTHTLQWSHRASLGGDPWADAAAVDRLAEEWAGEEQQPVGEVLPEPAAGDALPPPPVEPLPTDPGVPAADSQVLQSKAESIVARLEDVEDLKLGNPFTGQSFSDLLARLAPGRPVAVYEKNVPGDRLLQGTVAEQLVAVADCENERYMARARELRAYYEDRLQTQTAAHRSELDRLHEELLRERGDIERAYEERLTRHRQVLKEQTEELIKQGLQSQLQTERTKDELALASDDVVALRKLLLFWKKKNTTLKRAFDKNERKLLLAREKLRDFQYIHSVDAYRAHRFCGQLRERDVNNRAKAQELQHRNRQRLLDLQNLRGDFGRADELESRSSGDDPDDADDGPARLTTVPVSERVDPAEARVCSLLSAEVERSRAELASRCRMPLQSSSGSFAADAAEAAAVAAVRPDQAALAEYLALREGVRLRDEEIDVALAALQLRDQRVSQLRDLLDATERRAYDLETKVFDPFTCEELVQAKGELEAGLMQAKDRIAHLQREHEAERAQAADEAARRADAELHAAKQRTSRDLLQQQLIRERDTEIIRLRSRLRDAGRVDDGSSAARIVKLEQEKAGLLEQISDLDEEKLRLKHYVQSLGARLEQAQKNLEEVDSKVRQYEEVSQSVRVCSSAATPSVHPAGLGSGSPQLPRPSVSPDAVQPMTPPTLRQRLT